MKHPKSFVLVFAVLAALVCLPAASAQQVAETPEAALLLPAAVEMTEEAAQGVPSVDHPVEETVDVEAVKESVEAGSSTPLFGGGFNYPSCFSKNGTYCSSPGSFSYCQYTPYEPEICVCQSNNTWRCVW